MEDAHKDSAANRENIFPLGYVYIQYTYHCLTEFLSVNACKIQFLTDFLSVSEKFSKYITQKRLLRRDECKQSYAENFLKLNGRRS